MLVFHKKFLEDITQKIDEHTSYVCNGHASDMQEYGHRCGYLLGMKDMLSVFQELQEKYKEE